MTSWISISYISNCWPIIIPSSSISRPYIKSVFIGRCYFPSITSRWIGPTSPSNYSGVVTSLSWGKTWCIISFNTLYFKYSIIIIWSSSNISSIWPVFELAMRMITRSKRTRFSFYIIPIYFSDKFISPKTTSTRLSIYSSSSINLLGNIST